MSGGPRQNAASRPGTSTSPNARAGAPGGATPSHRHMAPTALVIRHRTHPGRRDQVRAVWDRRVREAAARNPGHAAYFYCFDDGDPDAICAFQQYVDAEAARAFLATESHAAYLREVGRLLAGPPEVTSLTPVWNGGP